MSTQPQRFSFAETTSIPPGRSKKVAMLCRTDRVLGAIQVIAKGGENNLHSHEHLDGIWTVLSGKARFYGEGNVVLAELGRYEGILIPRGFKYWFESASDAEPLVVLQCEASDIAMPTIKDVAADRIDFEPRKASFVQTP